jgi:hypothetical protein
MALYKKKLHSLEELRKERKLLEEAKNRPRSQNQIDSGASSKPILKLLSRPGSSGFLQDADKPLTIATTILSLLQKKRTPLGIAIKLAPLVIRFVASRMAKSGALNSSGGAPISLGNPQTKRIIAQVKLKALDLAYNSLQVFMKVIDPSKPKKTARKSRAQQSVIIINKVADSQSESPK